MITKDEQLSAALTEYLEPYDDDWSIVLSLLDAASYALTEGEPHSVRDKVADMIMKIEDLIQREITQ